MAHTVPYSLKVISYVTSPDSNAFYTFFTLKYSAFLLFYILQGVVALFAGANLDNIFDIIDKYLAVTDMTGVKNLFSSFDNAANRNLAYYNVKLNFRQKRCFHLNAAVILGFAFLQTAAEYV